MIDRELKRDAIQELRRKMSESEPLRVEKIIITRAIKELKKRSPGEDGIVLGEIRMVNQDSLIDYLKILFGKIIETTILPTALRSSIILPIPKTGKTPHGATKLERNSPDAIVREDI